MKKIIAINGSPRRNGNTAELLQHALRGAEEAGAGGPDETLRIRDGADDLRMAAG